MKTGLTLTEVDVRIAAIRENLEELVEQSAADSSAGNDDLNAARIAEQEKELAELTELREALLRNNRKGCANGFARVRPALERCQPLSLSEILEGVDVEERIERLGRPGDRRHPVARVQASTLRSPSTTRASRNASRNPTFHSPITG